jgi:LacI family transcriptional regulator
MCSLLNKKIPEDVGIVGFDDLSIASSLSPPLSTIQYRIASMADMTVNLLLASIRNPNEPYDNYYVEPNLVIRGSSVLSGR